MLVISKAYNKYVKCLHIVKGVKMERTFELREGTTKSTTSTIEERQ
jgi:hypothetical protein